MDGDERRRALSELSEQWVATTDGRQLRAVVAGTGTDLVVLEAGLGAAALTWGPVMEHLAPHCRVVAYDRAGYGRSDPGPGARDLSRLADDLLAVVGAVDHSRLVLAGHSWGGPLARLAAARLMEAAGSLRDGPDARHGAGRRSLTGLVLVDPADEHAELYFSRAMRVQRALQGPMLQVLARCGLLRPLLHAQGAALPEPYRSCAAGDASTLTAARTMVAENAHVIRGLRSLRLDPLDLGAVPLTVVSGCLAGGGDRTVREQLIQAHSASAGAHPGGRHVRAWRSGHLVPFTEPDLVADEILALLA
ncbi:MAG TPA: alpha/beta hydrolase [Candidatus Brachybacterium merdavium]|uniref:Alpha/beta hydrolase n=1 Tax=Candidatus Brachybacterium merdavium TaxID=2838513 RepID=A0A9D2LBM7_9MICO|nr:alpha/beta hydrolase [Candidatus Brachybacterium merdavium]